jgi:NitT/TauT family transport system substrate-binding protein
MAVAPKDMTMLVVGYDALPNYVRLCLTMTGKTVSGRREDAINFVAAEMDALKFALGSRDDTIKLTQDTNNYKPDDPRAAYVFDDTVKHHAVDATTALPLDKLTWMQDELVKAGNLKESIDLAKITAADIRAEAAKRVKQ